MKRERETYGQFCFRWLQVLLMLHGEHKRSKLWQVIYVDVSRGA